MSAPTLLDCFGPNVTEERKAINHIAAKKSMEDMMVKYLRVGITEVDNGDCEYGCWNTGYGVQVHLQQVPGDTKTEELLYEQQACASCCDRSEIDYDALLEFISRYTENDNSYVLDLGDTSDYPESFLEEVM